MKRTWIRQAATLTLLGLAGVAGAAEIEAIKVAYAKGTFTVDAQMLLQAPVAAVRAALTDYEHLDQLSDAIAESHLLRQDADAATVFTRTRASRVRSTCSVARAKPGSASRRRPWAVK